jgi:putative peptidoglycan lipid II flippase
LAGVLQLLFLLPRLRRLGFRFLSADAIVRRRVRQILQAMLPVLVGLSITQFNTLADSLIAWGLTSVPVDSPIHLESGTASALYFGQRLYQFPLGVFGIALGTALFPRLSRHAARDDMHSLRDDLCLGLRLVVGIGLPASLGLVLLAEPLTSLLFVRGQFTIADGRATAAMIGCYGTGVWAYCGLLIVTRAYYAVGDRTTPLSIGLFAVAVNLPLNFLLIFVVGSRGLALATAGTAALQVALATWCVQRHVGKLPWRSLGLCALRAVVATTAMGLVCWWLLLRLPHDSSLWRQGLRVVVPLCVSAGTYFTAAHLLGLHEWKLLVWRTGGAVESPQTESAADASSDGSESQRPGDMSDES